jgi:hypothetical protein
MLSNSDKQGRMTIDKLIAITIGVTILIFIIVGVVGGGFAPLGERLKTQWDTVLIKLKLLNTEQQEFSGDCFEWQSEPSLGSNAQFRVCRGYCDVEIPTNLYRYDPSSKKTYKYWQDKDIIGYSENNREEVTGLTTADLTKKKEWENIYNLEILPTDSSNYNDNKEYYKGIYTQYSNAHQDSLKIIVTENKVYRITQEYTIFEHYPMYKVYGGEKIISGEPFLNPIQTTENIEEIQETYKYLVENCK